MSDLLYLKTFITIELYVQHSYMCYIFFVKHVILLGIGLLGFQIIALELLLFA